ncbi:hypothetical protein HGM15179_015099, partial [Zosterops borbonicus]
RVHLSCAAEQPFKCSDQKEKLFTVSHRMKLTLKTHVTYHRVTISSDRALLSWRWMEAACPWEV